MSPSCHGALSSSSVSDTGTVSSESLRRERKSRETANRGSEGTSPERKSKSKA